VVWFGLVALAVGGMFLVVFFTRKKQ